MLNATAETFIERFRALPLASQRRVRAALKRRQSEDRLLTASELCSLLRISRATLHRHLAEGPPRGSRGGDIRLITQVRIGRQLRFERHSVEAFLNNE